MDNSNLKQSVGTVFFAKSTQRFLFLLRSETSFDNTWAFVGGKLDPHESIIQGLMREIHEEINFTGEVEKHIPIEKFINTKKKFEYHTFVTVVEGEFIPMLNTEHKGYAWTTIDSWPRPLHPGVFNTINVNEIRAKITTISELFGYST